MLARLSLEPSQTLHTAFQPWKAAKDWLQVLPTGHNDTTIEGQKTKTRAGLFFFTHSTPTPRYFQFTFWTFPVLISKVYPYVPFFNPSLICGCAFAHATSSLTLSSRLSHCQQPLLRNSTDGGKLTLHLPHTPSCQSHRDTSHRTTPWQRTGSVLQKNAACRSRCDG